MLVGHYLISIKKDIVSFIKTALCSSKNVQQSRAKKTPFFLKICDFFENKKNKKLATRSLHNNKQVQQADSCVFELKHVFLVSAMFWIIFEMLKCFALERKFKIFDSCRNHHFFFNQFFVISVAARKFGILSYFLA
jgi:hypothetical protein